MALARNRPAGTGAGPDPVAGSVYLVRVVCGHSAETCGWQGWVEARVRRLPPEPPGEADFEVEPPEPNLWSCPTCGRNVYRAGAVVRSEPARIHPVRRRHPGFAARETPRSIGRAAVDAPMGAGQRRELLGWGGGVLLLVLAGIVEARYRRLYSAFAADRANGAVTARQWSAALALGVVILILFGAVTARGFGRLQFLLPFNGRWTRYGMYLLIAALGLLFLVLLAGPPLL